MNPLTLVKRIKEINSKEAALGISEGASWHVKYKDSPYVYVGGLPFDLTEGDLLAIFSQYGEIVDVNLVRHKATGKSRGFAFVAYEDQRSTNLAVDNLNGASVVGRIIRVDHVSDYKKKEEEDEEMEQQKREARGVCRAFQRGDCTRGATCKFSHDEQRCADTGWGAKEDGPNWKHDKHEIPPVRSGRSANVSNRIPKFHDQAESINFRSDDKGNRLSRAQDDNEDRKSYSKQREINQDMQRSEKSGKEPNRRDWDRHATEITSGKYESEPKSKEDSEWRRKDDRSLKHASERNPRDDPDRKKSGRHNSELNPGEDRDRKSREENSSRQGYDRSERDPRSGEKRPRYEDNSSSRHHREEDDRHSRRTRR